MNLSINLPASATEAGAAGDPYETSIEYFDSVGRAHQVRAVFTPVVPGSGASNQWTLELYDIATSDTTPIAQIDLAFDDSRTGRGGLLSVTPVSGAAYDLATGTAQVNVADGPIDVFIGSPDADGGLIQLDSPFQPINVSKNGAPAGNLQRLTVDDQGIL